MLPATVSRRQEKPAIQKTMTRRIHDRPGCQQCRDKKKNTRCRERLTPPSWGKNQKIRCDRYLRRQKKENGNTLTTDDVAASRIDVEGILPAGTCPERGENWSWRKVPESTRGTGGGRPVQLLKTAHSEKKGALNSTPAAGTKQKEKKTKRAQTGKQAAHRT